MNPLEALLSVYLVAHSPFLARLRVEEIEVGSRLKLLRYTKSNGGTVMYQLTSLKMDPSHGKIPCSAESRLQRLIRILSHFS